MPKEKKTLKFQMMMAPGEAEVLDDWMFKNRIRSRAEAIRRLCQIGLATSERMQQFEVLQSQFEQTSDKILSLKSELTKSVSSADLVNLVRAYMDHSTNFHKIFMEMYYISRFVHAATDASSVSEALEDVNSMKEIINISSKSTLEEFESYVESLEGKNSEEDTD